MNENEMIDRLAMKSWVQALKKQKNKIVKGKTLDELYVMWQQTSPEVKKAFYHPEKITKLKERYSTTVEECED